jgi:hypothetical protein
MDSKTTVPGKPAAPSGDPELSELAREHGGLLIITPH